MGLRSALTLTLEPKPKHGQVAEKAYVAMRKKGAAGARGDQCIVVSGERG